MVAYRIRNPGGIVPRFSARELPGESAQAASNLSVLNGEWRPMRKSKELWAPSFPPAAMLSFARIDASTWLGWQASGVDFLRTEIQGEARFAYTGDGVPKVTTKTLASPVSATGTPAAARTLGIPAPVATPTLSHSGGTGAAVTRFYCYTFYSDWNEESPPSPVSPVVTGKVDGTWSFGGMDAAPPNSGSVTAATHSGGVVTATLGAGNHYLRVGDQITIAGVVGMTDLNGVWTVASVPAANQITVQLTTAQAYTSGGTWNRVHPWGTCTKRIYRTAGTAAGFQLVDQGVTGTSYADTLLDANILGDSLISQNWAPPPVDLIGLTPMPGGILAGWRAGTNIVCFCEPYQPHAWPTSYQRKAPADIVGMACYDTNLAVGTSGYPVIYSGYTPGQMTVTRHAKPLPCLSRYSVCSVADGVVYASKNGLVRVDLNGAEMFTAPLFTPEGWNDQEPASMICAFDGARLYFSSPVGNRIFILNMQEGGALVTSYQPIDSMRADPDTGDMFFLFGKAVYRIDSFDASPLTMDWWSKEYMLPKPVNLGAAKVEFDQEYSDEANALFSAELEATAAENQASMASVWGGRGALARRVLNKLPINGSALQQVPSASVSISFTLYANKKVICTVPITSQRVFRLPSGYKADNFSVRIQANTQIKAVLIGDTPQSLAQV